MFSNFLNLLKFLITVTPQDPFGIKGGYKSSFIIIIIIIPPLPPRQRFTRRGANRHLPRNLPAQDENGDDGGGV